MAVLIVEEGTAPGKALPLSGSCTVLGRHPSCEIVLENDAVSRHHARLQEEHGQFYIEDLHSRNGTMINEQPITERTEIRDGDLIGICSIALRFYRKIPDGEDTEQASGWQKGLIARTMGGVDPSRSTMEDEAEAGDQAQGWAAADTDGNGLRLVPPMSSVDMDDSDTSSIISRLRADGTDSSWRLAVRPEVKLRAITRIAKALRHVLASEHVLETILDGMFEIFPQAEDAHVVLVSAPNQQVVVGRSQSSASGAPPTQTRISHTILERVLKTKEAILTADAMEDSRFNMSDSLSQLQIRSLMSAPLLRSDGNPMGILQLDTRNIRRQFSPDDLDVLAMVAWHAALAIENAELHEQIITQREMARELQAAREIQRGLLPRRRPVADGYEFHDFYCPAASVGGDFFNYVPLSDNRIAVMIGDVSGKGIPAALIMARMFSAARYHLEVSATPAEAVTALNEELNEAELNFRFVTFLMLVLNTSTGEITFVNAGHLPMLLRSSDGTVAEHGLVDSGYPLGVVDNVEYKNLHATLPAGGVLLLFTDGISESMRDDRQLFGRERLGEVLASATGTAEEIVNKVIDDAEQFAGDQTARDDACVVCIQRSAVSAR